jgi:toxin CcdB
MARFDVFRIDRTDVLVVDIQADILSGLDTRVVVPLVPADTVQREAMPRLKPLLSVAGVDYRLITTDLAAVPTSELVACIANLEDQRGTIIDAIDFLMQGF